MSESYDMDVWCQNTLCKFNIFPETCSPGFTSTTGMSPCTPCGKGFYSTSTTACAQCDPDSTTKTDTAGSINECTRKLLSQPHCLFHGWKLSGFFLNSGLWGRLHRKSASKSWIERFLWLLWFNFSLSKDNWPFKLVIVDIYRHTASFKSSGFWKFWTFTHAYLYSVLYSLPNARVILFMLFSAPTLTKLKGILLWACRSVLMSVRTHEWTLVGYLKFPTLHLHVKGANKLKMRFIP